jgi:hypothetical protein
MSSSDHEKRTEKALRHCRSLIDYYERARVRARRTYILLQSSSIFLSGLTPILILGTELPKIYQALPAAIASIGAGIAATFHLQENWISFKNSSEALKGELVAFETRTSEWYQSELGEDRVLDNFLFRVEGIHQGQITEWSARQIQRSMLPSDAKSKE